MTLSARRIVLLALAALLALLAGCEAMTPAECATADWGRLVGVTATVSKTGYTRAQDHTYLSKDIANGIMKPGTLKLKGTTKVGSKLSVVRGGTRTASAHVQYSWYRNGKRIAGATKSSYKLAKADRGKRVAVRLEVSRVRYTMARVTATSSKIR